MKPANRLKRYIKTYITQTKFLQLVMLFVFLWLLFSGLLSFLVSLAVGHTYYVATNGQDTEPGTTGQPWAETALSAKLSAVIQELITRKGK